MSEAGSFEAPRRAVDEILSEALDCYRTDLMPKIRGALALLHSSEMVQHRRRPDGSMRTAGCQHRRPSWRRVSD